MEKKISEAAWKRALTSIIKKLSEPQYEKMLRCLTTMPESVKKNSSKEEMAQKIIEYLGLEESISMMEKVLERIPRRDEAVQKPLRPFVDKLRNKQEKEKDKGEKRKHDDSESETEETETAEMEKKISEAAWKRALTSIIKKLGEPQYEKMLRCLTTMPESVKKNSSKEEMAQKIIEYLGLEESISVMEKVLERIPRRDEAVQKPLRPFVDKLRNKQEKEKDKDQQKKSGQSDKETAHPSPGNSKSWRKTIKDLKESRYLGNQAIVGKVIRKSGLRPYRTQNKEEKVMFYLGLADETDSIKAVVYGKNRYEEIEEGSYYSFREVIIEDNTVKVTKLSKISKTSNIQVPAELEKEARMIIDPQKPVLPIKEAKASGDKTEMSVEGTITELTPVSQIKVKGGQRRTALQRDLHLQDDTGSIRIRLWDDQANQCTAAVGDSIRVTNVKTNHFMETVSLSSTGLTRVYKVEAAAVQTETVQIIGIIKASKKETWLEAVLDQEVKTLVVESKLLETFGIKLGGNFKERLLDKMPLSAEAEIQGNTIRKITKM
ncbi:neurofilament medium polypeptide-like isoform X2 [Centroberyx affinis]|uniref:neurofilament medium polypeptide-like isoform X2 n=1 Tax=Centroberyx affinis TaxID=166261 RepID=UPI003A5C3C7F